jgi:hypothetical protein
MSAVNQYVYIHNLSDGLNVLLTIIFLVHLAETNIN